MSKLKFSFIVYFSINLFSYSQKINDSILLINKNDKLISSFLINEGLSRLSVGIYINGYECVKKRKMQIKKNERDGNNIPTFSINFVSFAKPQKLNSISSLKFSKLKDFNPKLKIPSPFYILLKGEDENYLLWKANLNPME